MKTALSCVLLSVALQLALVGCATNSALEDSRRLFNEGRMEDGVLRLEQATRDSPADRALRTEYFRQRDLAIAQLLAAADGERAAQRFDAAQTIYQQVRRLDSNHARAREGLQEITLRQRHAVLLQQADALLGRRDQAGAERLLRAILAENPSNAEARRALMRLREVVIASEPAAPVLTANFSRPITLEFRDTPLRTVFEVISRSAGINFVFDRDVRADARVTIFMRNTPIEEVVRLLLATNQLERKLLNDNSMLVYPNTPAKAREYVELVTRSFYLVNADVKQAQLLVRSLVKTRDIFVDEKLNLLIMKDTPDAVRLAERLLESLDMAEPEVMLEVEVLEVTRSKLQELGLRFPDQIGYGLLQPTTSSTVVNSGVTQTSTNLGGNLSSGFVDLQNRGALTSFVSNPAVLLNLKSQAGDGNLLANPRIRVKNREKARIHIGDKLPVFTTTSTPNVGVSASVAYLDVGLKLEVEPNISLDDEVSIKVGMEVSSVVREVPGPASSLAYQVGTRSVSTVLRLRNGETQVLAGLISDEERSSANRLPGLGDLPFVGRLFSSQRDNASKTEIVLLITPRIVRNLARGDTLALPAGSDAAVGAPGMQLKRTEPRSLSLSGTPATALPAAVPEPEPEPPPATPAPATQPAPAAAIAPAAVTGPAVAPIVPAAPATGAIRP